MEREIKFKIWDLTNEYFLAVTEDPDYTIEFTGDGSLFLRDNGKERKDVLFIEYTGLKDKNGEEIYQGDLTLNFGLSESHEVVFNQGAWGYIIHKGEPYEEFISFSGNGNFKIKNNTSEHIEKVGNVYEKKSNE